jgi:FkbM family methyltransferase
MEAIEFACETGSFSIVNTCTSAKNVCVFGLGGYFRGTFASRKFKENLGVNILCDNDPQKWGKVFEGLVCVPPDDLTKLDDLVVIPLVGGQSIEGIRKQLYGLNIQRHIDPNLYCFEYVQNMPRTREWFAKNRILDVYDMLADKESKRVYATVLCNRIAFGGDLYSTVLCPGKEYFPAVFSLGADEVFVDCGAYTGDSMLKFIRALGGKSFKAIHAFEIEAHNFAKLEKKAASLKNAENIFCHRAAVWNKTGILSFGRDSVDGGMGGSIRKTGDVFFMDRVSSVRIDDVAPNATFIKMDVEGAELNALKGAENTIKGNAPKLAISLYHQLNDLWEIPVYLHEIMPEYRFYVRHYAANAYNTTLYACK